MITLPAVLFVALFAALAPGLPPPARTPGEGGRAILDVQQETGVLVVQAHFVGGTGPQSEGLRYTLEVTKEGRSRSTSRQGGAFTVVPGWAEALATSRVGVTPGDHVTIVLTVFDGARPLDTARFDTTAAP